MRRLRVLVLIAASLPPLFAALSVTRYGANVPFADQWELAPLLWDAANGQLHWDALWAQHNEHRLVLPKLVMLALAQATDWDVRYELFLNMLLAVGVLAVVIRLLWQSVRPVAPTLTPWLVFIASLLGFSSVQWQNWTWGWQMAIFLNVLAAVAVVWAVARYGRSWRGFALGFLGATVGLLSFANGLVLLLLLPVGLLLVPQSDLRPGPLRIVAIAGLGGVAMGVPYLVGFRYPDHGPGFVHPDPETYAQFLVINLGASIGPWGVSAATFWGVVGLLLFVGCAAYLWLAHPFCRHAIKPWALLGLYAMLSSAMIGVGRSGFGVEYALSSRYTTITLIFWISLAVLLGLALWNYWRTTQGSRRASVALTGCLVLLAAVSYIIASAASLSALRLQKEELEKGRGCLQRYREAADECLNLLYHDASVLRQRAEWLERMRVSVFARTGQSH